MASRSRLTCFAALFLALPMIGCAHRPAPEQPAPAPVQDPAQSVPEHPLPSPPVAPPPERTTDRWAEHYLIGKQLEAAQLRAAGLGADWDFIRDRVTEHLPPQSYPGRTPSAEVLLRHAHVYSTASFLVRIGYRARHLAHPEQARILVRAANIRSWDDADALVIVSPTVFVADLVGIDRKADNSAELVYRVSEPIKSAPARGSEFRYPIHGPAPTVSIRPGEPPPPPPPNPGAAALSNRERVLYLRPAPDAIGNFFGPLYVKGERVLPGYHSDTGETTLPKIQATVREQLCSPGYLPVVEGVSIPTKC